MTKEAQQAYDLAKETIWRVARSLSPQETLYLTEELIAELEGIADNAKQMLKESKQ